MQENILNLPHHLRRLRFVPSQRAALAMAGEYHLNELREIDRNMLPELWFAASAYHESMLNAITNENLRWHTCWKNMEGDITRALFRPDDIWSWAQAELSDDSPWYGADIIPSVSVVSTRNDIALPHSDRSYENLQLLNAGLSRLLVARSHKAYLYGKKPNISALARDVAAEVAYVLPPDADKTESFRKALSDALSLLPAIEMQADE